VAGQQGSYLQAAVLNLRRQARTSGVSNNDLRAGGECPGIGWVGGSTARVGHPPSPLSASMDHMPGAPRPRTTFRTGDGSDELVVNYPVSVLLLVVNYPVSVLLLENGFCGYCREKVPVSNPVIFNGPYEVGQVAPEELGALISAVSYRMAHRAPTISCRAADRRMRVKAMRTSRILGGYRTSHHVGKRSGAMPSVTAW
jgi:hypothetical protein